MKKTTRVVGAAVAASALLLMGLESANAATDTWSATPVDSNLANPANYNPALGAVPASGDTLLFNTGSTQTTLTDVNGLSPLMNDNNEFEFLFQTGAAAYTIGLTSDRDTTGNGFVNVSVAAGVTANETFNPAIEGYARTALATFYLANGATGTTLTLNGGFINDSTAAPGVPTWKIDFSGTTGNVSSTVENGVIADGTGGQTEIQVANSVVLTLNNANTYSGPTLIGTNNGAGLILGNKAALGTGMLTLAPGGTGTPISSNTNLSGANAVANPVAITTQNGVVNFTGSNNLTFSGNFDLNNTASASSPTLQVTNTAVTTLAGPVINSGGATTNLNKTGAGSLVLAGTNTYTGNTYMSAGTLLVSNTTGTDASAYYLTSGTAAFGGSGKISGIIGIVSGTTFLPGAGTAANSTGILTSTSTGQSALILSAGSFTNTTINGTTEGSGYDNFTTAGKVTYGGALTINFAAAPSASTNYSLFTSAIAPAGDWSSIALSGLFSGTLTDASGVWSGTAGSDSFVFTDATGVLAVTVVPEPATLGLLLCGVSAFAMRGRRREAQA